MSRYNRFGGHLGSRIPGALIFLLNVCSLFCCFCSSLKHFTVFDLLACSTPWWGSAASFPWKSGRLGNMSGRCPHWTASDCDTCQDQYNTEAKLMLRERAERAKLGSRAVRVWEREGGREIFCRIKGWQTSVCVIYMLDFARIGCRQGSTPIQLKNILYSITSNQD